VTVLDRDYEASTKARALTNVDHALGRIEGTLENVVAVARRTLTDDWAAERDLDSHYYQFDAEARALLYGDPMPVPFEEAKWTITLLEEMREVSAAPPKIGVGSDD
jgi:hypothetical protein